MDQVIEEALGYCLPAELDCLTDHGYYLRDFSVIEQHYLLCELLAVKNCGGEIGNALGTELEKASRELIERFPLYKDRRQKTGYLTRQRAWKMRSHLRKSYVEGRPRAVSLEPTVWNSIFRHLQKPAKIDLDGNLGSVRHPEAISVNYTSELIDMCAAAKRSFDSTQAFGAQLASTKARISELEEELEIFLSEKTALEAALDN